MRKAGSVLVFALALLAPALCAAQTALQRLGFLVSAESSRLDAFRQELAQQGYREGRNALFEYRYFLAKRESLDVLARELVQLKVDVIVTEGTPPTLAARRATDSIPIVVTAAGDLVAVGLVASLARPGGNVTGLTLQSPEISGKRLAILKDLVPQATAMAMLLNRENRLLHPLVWKETQEAAQTRNVKLQRFEVERPDDFEAAFAAMVKAQARALLIPLDPMFNAQRARLVELAAQSGLPVMFGERLYVEAGGLASYGPNYLDLYRRAAVLVARILKGTKPAELPVEQPTKFELVINLKAAKALGLTVPQSLRLQADQLIE